MYSIARGDDFVIEDFTTLWSLATATTATVQPPTSAVLDVPTYVDQALTRNELQNGRLYYFIVRLTNSAGQQGLLSSNGLCPRSCSLPSFLRGCLPLCLLLVVVLC